MLKLRDVHASYGAVIALQGISIEVQKGEIVCLIGANGAGKSTVLRSISGLIAPTKGEILFEDKPIHNIKPETIVRMGISHAPEGRRVLPGLSVEDNMILGTTPRKGISKQVINADLEQMYDLFPDLKRLRTALGWTLSGGQQQMLSVARGLMARPQVLMMDEPSLGLAPIIVQQVFKTIVEINETLGTTVLLVEQNASMALSISHRGYVLETGKIVVNGPAKGLLTNSVIQEAYLGGRVRNK